MVKRKENLELTLIENCVIRSRSILIAKAYLLSLKEAKFFAHRYNKVLPRTESLSSLIDSVYLAIQEDKRAIAKHLSPLLNSVDITLDTKEGFWFTNKDLKKGFVLLYKSSTDTPAYVLVLTTFKSAFLQFNAGELHPFETIAEFLNDANPVPGYNSVALKYSLYKIKKYGKR